MFYFNNVVFMKKKLLLLLMAGFSMVMLPACGDDDDDDVKNEQNDQKGDDQKGDEQKNDEQKDDEQKDDKQTADTTVADNTSFPFTSLLGVYHGALTYADGSSLADTLGVVVESHQDGSIDLSLEPIVINNLPIGELSFPNMPCTYDSTENVWKFSASSIAVTLMSGAVNAVVDVKDGKFSNDGTLAFSAAVNAGLMNLDIVYKGNK